MEKYFTSYSVLCQVSISCISVCSYKYTVEVAQLSLSPSPNTNVAKIAIDHGGVKKKRVKVMII